MHLFYLAPDWKRVDKARIAVEDQIKLYQANLKTIQIQQIDVLSQLVDDIKNSGSCMFLKTTWEETYGVLCVDAKDALGVLGTMSLIVGIFGFFSAFCLLWFQQTNGGHGPTKADEGESNNHGTSKIVPTNERNEAASFVI